MVRRGEIPPFLLKEGESMVRLPERGEIEDVLEKLGFGFELEDREIWICKEFLGK